MPIQYVSESNRKFMGIAAKGKTTATTPTVVITHVNVIPTTDQVEHIKRNNKRNNFDLLCKAQEHTVYSIHRLDPLKKKTTDLGKQN